MSTIRLNGTNCSKCGSKAKQLYQVVVGPKLRGNFCPECYNKWFDERDKVVEEAFQTFVAKSK